MVFDYYKLLTDLSYFLGAGFILLCIYSAGCSIATGMILSNKSTEKVYGIKSWKDASKLRKAFYVFCPGAYFGIQDEKSRRHELEKEFIKKYKIEPVKI